MRCVAAQSYSTTLVVPRLRLPDLQLVLEHRRVFRDPCNRTLVRLRPPVPRDMRFQPLQTICIIVVVFNVSQRPGRKYLERPCCWIFNVRHIEHICPNIVTCWMNRNVHEWMQMLFDEQRLLFRVRSIEVHEREGKRLLRSAAIDQTLPNLRTRAVSANHDISFLARSVLEDHSYSPILYRFVATELLLILHIQALRKQDAQLPDVHFLRSWNGKCKRLLARLAIVKNNPVFANCCTIDAGIYGARIQSRTDFIGQEPEEVRSCPAQSKCPVAVSVYILAFFEDTIGYTG